MTTSSESKVVCWLEIVNDKELRRIKKAPDGVEVTVFERIDCVMVRMSLVMAPDERCAENLRINKEKSVTDVEVEVEPPSVLMSIIELSFRRTSSNELRADLMISYLSVKNSIEPTVSPPVMSTSSAAPITPVAEITDTARLEAVTDTPVISDNCWLKMVIWDVNVCLNDIKDFLMKLIDFTSPAVGCTVRDEHAVTTSAAVF
jgi:hypothetical protein